MRTSPACRSLAHSLDSAGFRKSGWALPASGGLRSAGWRGLTAGALALGLLIFGVAQSCIVDAQENPPRDLPKVLEGAIKPDAFYFVDDQGNRVMFPGMSLEEIDRMKKVDIGYVQPAKPYTIESVSIQGSADAERAELTVVAKLKVSGAQGKWVEIPLKMKGFHRGGPADVVGVENYKVDTAEDGGVRLWVKTDQPREIELRTRVVCRVLAELGQGIEFDLPSAPTKVSLSVRGDDLSASVIGRGDEVVNTEAAATGETKIEVECSGGAFVLSWRMRDGRRESDQVLEVDSRMRVVWTDPQSPASVVVELDVNNRRGGSLAPFEVKVPEGADLIEPLQGSSLAQLSARDPKTGKIQVTPDDSEPLSRLKVTLEYRLPSGDYRGENPLLILPVEVPSAVRQGGEIEIRTDRNYRLRWKQQPNVRSIWRAASSDPVDSRVYSFQFDRTAFELPVWLTAKQQRLRVEPEYTIRVGRDSATMEARIIATGTIIEGVPLVINAAGWQTLAVEDLETGRSVDDPLGDNGEGLELELGELTPSSSSSVGVLWKAVRPTEQVAPNSSVNLENPPAVDLTDPPTVDSETGEATSPESNATGATTTGASTEADLTAEEAVVRFELPIIGSPDDRAVIVSQGTLSIRPESGLAIVPDMESSVGLTRLPAESTTNRSTSSLDSSEGVLRFRVLSIGALPAYQGYIITRSPEADIDVRVKLSLDGEFIRVVNTWLVTPRGRLQGQMPVVMQVTKNSGSRGIGNSAKQLSGDDWLVRVDGQPAFLRDDGAGKWTLFSERLGGEVCRVEFEAVAPLLLQVGEENADSDSKPKMGEATTTAETLAEDQSNNSDTLSVVLPRPALAGNSLGLVAPVTVTAPSEYQVLLGEQGVDGSSSEPFNALSEPKLQVRVRQRVQVEEVAQFVGQALLRTELGKSRRYDRLLARVVGAGGNFEVGFLPATDRSLSAGLSEKIIRVWVNGQEVLDYQRSLSGLILPLPQDRTSHLVDIQIWRPRSASGLAGTVRPELRLPISTGKTYWDVVMASDRHLIWSSPSSSALMLWRYENLFVHRAATRSYSDLLAWIGGPPPTESQGGNRYLLVTSDAGSLQICEAGRPLLWFTIGGTILGISIILFYAPVLRHPLLLIFGALAVAGLAWMVPDLAVISGQLMIAALVLVAIMLGTRALLSRRPRATVLGGVPENSSVRSGAIRRGGAAGNATGEGASKRLSETVSGGSAAGVQS